MTLTPPGGDHVVTPPWLAVLAASWLLLALAGLVAAGLSTPPDLCTTPQAVAAKNDRPAAARPPSRAAQRPPARSMT